MPKKVTAEGFIRRAREIHHDRYDYSAVSYINTSTKLIIICPIHGNFLQPPAKHMFGRGCPECAGNVKGDIVSFIQKAQAVHGDFKLANLIRDTIAELVVKFFFQVKSEVFLQRVLFK